MSQEVTYNEHAAKALETLSKGAFLTTASAGKTNTMTIAWGNIGFMWGQPIFTVMVRPSRYTQQLIEQSGEFTVSIPLADMQQALSVCGAKSGRDTDKFALAGLSLAPGQKISTPVIAGCGLYYECKVVYQQAMNPETLQPDQSAKWYPNGDFHTLYFGQIVACYTAK